MSSIELVLCADRFTLLARRLLGSHRAADIKGMMEVFMCSSGFPSSIFPLVVQGAIAGWVYYRPFERPGRS